MKIPKILILIFLVFTTTVNANENYIEISQGEKWSDAEIHYGGIAGDRAVGIFVEENFSLTKFGIFLGSQSNSSYPLALEIYNSSTGHSPGDLILRRDFTTDGYKLWQDVNLQYEFESGKGYIINLVISSPDFDDVGMQYITNDGDQDDIDYGPFVVVEGFLDFNASNTVHPIIRFYLDDGNNVCLTDPSLPECDPCTIDPESCDPCLTDPSLPECDPCTIDPESCDPCLTDPDSCLEEPEAFNQIIKVTNTPKGVLGRTSVLEVAYDTTDNNNQLSGLGMRVHFDSSLLSFKEITGLIEQDIIVDGQGPFSDDNDFDNDPLTDQYMLFGWASLYNNWPNTELPTVLMNIAFDVSENINTDVISSTNINFTDTSFTAGYEFSAESYELEILNATWDFDGNGQADALSDGLMMLRYLFGLRGEMVTNLAISPESPLSSEEVVAEIEAAMDVADIDADGQLNALTDGLLLLRYLFGLRDDILTNGAVGPDATRSSDADIQGYLDAYMPAM
jgi:hypothetical protein